MGYLEYAEDDIPAEFIYGYTRKKDSKYEFEANPKHFSLMSKEEQEKYLKDLFKKKKISLDTMKKLEEKSKRSDIMGLADLVNPSVTPHDIEQQEELNKTKSKTTNEKGEPTI